jgi:hypothetical protein
MTLKREAGDAIATAIRMTTLDDWAKLVPFTPELVLRPTTDESSVGTAQQVVSQLDIVLVVPPARSAPPSSAERDDSHTQPGFETRFSVARGQASSVGWLLLDSSDPEAVRTAAVGAGALGAARWDQVRLAETARFVNKDRKDVHPSYRGTTYSA